MFLGLIVGSFREFQLFFGLQSGNVSVKLQHFGHVDLMAAVQELELGHLVAASSWRRQVERQRYEVFCKMRDAYEPRLPTCGEIRTYMSRVVHLEPPWFYRWACRVLAQPLVLSSFVNQCDLHWFTYPFGWCFHQLLRPQQAFFCCCSRPSLLVKIHL